MKLIIVLDIKFEGSIIYAIEIYIWKIKSNIKRWTSKGY